MLALSMVTYFINVLAVLHVPHIFTDGRMFFADLHRRIELPLHRCVPFLWATCFIKSIGVLDVHDLFTDDGMLCAGLHRWIARLVFR